MIKVLSVVSAQHYLTHLLREKLVESKSRVVVVSSGAVRNIDDPGMSQIPNLATISRRFDLLTITATLEATLANGSGAEPFPVYRASKFVQLLGAHWWRRQLQGQCDVVAVSPGLIPHTGLGRGSGIEIPAHLPDAKSVPEGAQSIIAAMSRSDFPEDRDRIFLTSWGEWWEKQVIERTVDKELQDKWSPSREELEKDAGIA